MRRIAGGELSRNRKARHPGKMCLQPTGKSGLIQRGGLGTGMVMPARQNQHRITVQRLSQPMPVQIRFAKSDQHKRSPPALPLDKRIGRQRRGQRGQGHVLRRRTRLRHHRRDRGPNALGQIVTRCQRLGGCDHMAFIPDQYRVGIGATRIHAQRQGHARPSSVRSPILATPRVTGPAGLRHPVTG